MIIWNESSWKWGKPQLQWTQDCNVRFFYTFCLDQDELNTDVKDQSDQTLWKAWIQLCES